MGRSGKIHTLLAEAELTLKDAVQNAETAEKNLREMEGETHKEGVRFVKKQHQQQNTQNNGSGNHTRCGRSGHRSSDCPYKNLVCRGCHC